MVVPGPPTLLHSPSTSTQRSFVTGLTATPRWTLKARLRHTFFSASSRKQKICHQLNRALRMDYKRIWDFSPRLQVKAEGVREEGVLKRQ